MLFTPSTFQRICRFGSDTLEGSLPSNNNYNCNLSKDTSMKIRDTNNDEQEEEVAEVNNVQENGEEIDNANKEKKDVEEDSNEPPIQPVYVSLFVDPPAEYHTVVDDREQLMDAIAKENQTYTTTTTDITALPSTKKKKTTESHRMPIDLTTDNDSIDKDTSTKSLANILMDEKDKKLVQVKREQEETRATLEDLREDLEIANETITHQMVFTDAWQSKFDDLKALAEAAGVDGAAIAAIKDR